MEWPGKGRTSGEADFSYSTAGRLRQTSRPNDRERTGPKSDAIDHSIYTITDEETV